jgi:hypothetical protein
MKEFPCLICERLYAEMEDSELCEERHAKARAATVKATEPTPVSPVPTAAPIVKIVPSYVGIWNPEDWRCEPAAYVIRVRIHPPGKRPGCPVRDDLTALELVTVFGSRWYGCASARVLPDGARVAMTPAPGQEHDEVVAKWADYVPKSESDL